MEIKLRYIIIALSLLVAVSFGAGFGAAYSRSKIRLAELAGSNSNLTSQLETAGRTIGSLAEKLESANGEIAGLTGRVGELTEDNKRYAEIVGNIGAGIPEDIEGLSGIYDSIGRYLAPAQETISE